MLARYLLSLRVRPSVRPSDSPYVTSYTETAKDMVANPTLNDSFTVVKISTKFWWDKPQLKRKLHVG